MKEESTLCLVISQSYEKMDWRIDHYHYGISYASIICSKLSVWAEISDIEQLIEWKSVPLTRFRVWCYVA